MDLGIADRTALVAGGARGSGLAISRELARAGAKVVLTGRDAQIVAKAAAELEGSGARGLGVVADMTVAGGVQAIFDAAAAGPGQPDILVINPPSPARTRGLLETGDQEFYECFDAYVMSVVRLIRTFVPAMVERKWGRVLLLGSANMKNPNSIDPIYTQNIRVAGAALMKTMTYEFSPSNITFNTVAIGAFHTDLAKDYLAGAPPGAYETFAAKVPLRRWGEPEELALAAAFLCSEAGGYINGEVIRIDGGQTESMF